MRAATLVDATDLISWADRRDCQGELPRLLRRLIHATVQRVIRAGFPAGEGVQTGGWDGMVSIEQGNAFVPDGISAWEVSARKDVKGKADDDYDKRTKETLGVDPAQSAYVFVTPRRWKEKEAWQKARQAEGIWREVRVYDADDLESWLELAPAMHIWLSVLLGKHPEGAIDLENWWEDWSAATEPPIPPELVLAGRPKVVEGVHEWLRGNSSTIALQSESHEEALAVFVAALQQLPLEERDIALSRAVIVRDETAWSRPTCTEASLILIPGFGADAQTVTRACRQGNRVVVPLGRSDSAAETTLSVPRISRKEAEVALTNSRVAEHDVRKLAALARRSLTSLRRRLAIRPEVQQPQWADPAEARALVPALLAGAWSSASQGDRKALSILADRPYEDLAEVFVRWSSESDPPVRRIGEAWYLVSKEDAWSLLARYLTRDDLETFSKVVADVLGSLDPRFDLPEKDWWRAGSLGAKLEQSGFLRQGFADTLALMRAQSETTPLSTALTSGDSAAHIVQELLRRANADWRLWASLSHVLPLLAEAAPEEFLEAVDMGLQGTSPVLIQLFREPHDLFGSSPHIWLLWALEGLAWSPEYLGSAALLLGKLARMDPGGNSRNRPANSLHEIFLLWHPQTSAPMVQRLAVLDMLSDREPEVAWQLLRSLLPQHSDIALGTHRPGWRDWGADPLARITYGEHAAAVREIFTRMLSIAGDRGTRWRDIICSLNFLSLEERDCAIDQLASIDAQGLQEEDRIAIWNSLRETLSKHRSYPDAHWALPEDILRRLDEIYRRLEPTDPVTANAWLFIERPALPEGRDSDHDAYGAIVADAQLDAIHRIAKEFGFEGLLKLVGSVERPFVLGHILGRSELATNHEDELLLQHLGADHAAYAEFSRAFALGRISIHGREWVEHKLAGSASDWPALQKAALLNCLPGDPRTWDLAEAEGQETKRLYWKTLSPYAIGREDIEIAVTRFLTYGRPYTAVELLDFLSYQQSPSAKLIVAALESVLQTSAEDDRPLDAILHRVPGLLDRLAASGEIEDDRLAKLEWAFLPLLDHHERGPEVLFRQLGRSPEFFVHIVSLVYRAEGEDPRELSSQENARVDRAWQLLETWHILPGTIDGVVDGDALKSWVNHARQLLAETGRGAIGDQVIGKILSRSPGGDDSAWPHQAVRDLIEGIASEHLERGFEVGVYNSRGVFTKSPGEGGAQERQLAARYTANAQSIRDRWPRTAAMLRRLADQYLAEARREDAETDLREDLDR